MYSVQEDPLALGLWFYVQGLAMHHTVQFRKKCALGGVMPEFNSCLCGKELILPLVFSCFL